MTRLQQALALLAGLSALAALALPFGAGEATVQSWHYWPLLAALVLALGALAFYRQKLPAFVAGLVAVLLAVALIAGLGRIATAGAGFWCALVCCWLLAWLFAERLAADIRAGRIAERPLGLLIPLMLGAARHVNWEAGTRGGNVPPVLLPPPSAIWMRIVESVPTLGADFQQTFLKAVLIGYALGCGAGFLIAIAIDRSPFLKRGLLPLGSFVSALPMVGIAPIRNFFMFVPSLAVTPAHHGRTDARR
jgi:NitT/TauT family transport system permease protein